MKTLHLVLVAFIAVLGMANSGFCARGGNFADTLPGFWANHAVVLARVDHLRTNFVDVTVLRVLSTSTRVPATISCENRTWVQADPIKVGSFAIFCLEIGPNGFILQPTALQFMPGAVAIALVADEKDPQIEQVAKTVQDILLKIQQEQVGAAKEAETNHIDKQIADYNSYWQNHALILAMNSQNPAGPALSMKIEIVSTLFTQIAVPQSLTINTHLPDYFMTHADGMALLVLEKQADGKFEAGGRIPVFAATDNFSFWQVQNEKDPKIDQIQKAVQSWQQQILDGEFPDDDKNKSPAPSPYLSPTTAPATKP